MSQVQIWVWSLHVTVPPYNKLYRGTHLLQERGSFINSRIQRSLEVCQASICGLQKSNKGKRTEARFEVNFHGPLTKLLLRPSSCGFSEHALLVKWSSGNLRTPSLSFATVLHMLILLHSLLFSCLRNMHLYVWTETHSRGVGRAIRGQSQSQNKQKGKWQGSVATPCIPDLCKFEDSLAYIVYQVSQGLHSETLSQIDEITQCLSFLLFRKKLGNRNT